MILSASGWRTIFAASGDEHSTEAAITREHTAYAVMAADVFADYMKARTQLENPVIACGMDTRPTCPAIADAVLRTLLAKKVIVRFTGVTAVPEIMAFSRKLDGFIYISASHNPIGYNGIKFGANDGGVLSAAENEKLVAAFNARRAEPQAVDAALAFLARSPRSDAQWVYAEQAAAKRDALLAYEAFVREMVSGVADSDRQDELFAALAAGVARRGIGIVCDMNGSARAASIDSDFFSRLGITFYAIHAVPGDIVHGIIPEGENLRWCADEMRRLRAAGHKDVVLGYLPDCDGDRGNVVYWDETKDDAVILDAQNVFSLSVLAELAYGAWLNDGQTSYRPAVCMNGPTSEQSAVIAQRFGAAVFRCEVGEAQVVALAAQKRADGYDVRVCGEGSNGGTIIPPSSVRDPLGTLCAFLKLLTIGDTGKKHGLYHRWCELSDVRYSEHFSIATICATLPAYQTTPSSAERAVIHLKTTDQKKLKKRFQQLFENEWRTKQPSFEKAYGITSYEAVRTNGTSEVRGITDFSESGTGGLKIVFSAAGTDTPCAFLWMRGSQTEPLFRILCDVQGARPELEHDILEWGRALLTAADDTAEQ
ncbi:MAG: phosphoglucomutase [Treponema sp.]|nr:phosphoglucomutase [Treponema sp.]